MSDTDTDAIGHGDQHDRTAPDQRDHGPATPDNIAGAESVPEEPIAGQEPDTSNAPESPSDADTKATGRDI